jgi:hypothetical protein
MMKRKFSKLKIEIDEHAIQLDELDELVEAKTRKVIKRKLIKQVVAAIQTDLEALESRMVGRVTAGYYDYVRDMSKATIKDEFKKGVRFKHKVIHRDVMHTYDPIGLMNSGWRIVYQGPLTFDEKGKKDPVTIFEKPVSTEAHAKVTIHKKRKKGSGKKKVKRNPKG